MCVCMLTPTHAHMCAHARSCAHMCTHAQSTRSCAHTHIHSLTHTTSHTCAHSCPHLQACVPTHTHAHTHVHIYARAHTYVHTSMPTLFLSGTGLAETPTLVHASAQRSKKGKRNHITVLWVISASRDQPGDRLNERGHSSLPTQGAATLHLTSRPAQEPHGGGGALGIRACGAHGPPGNTALPASSLRSRLPPIGTWPGRREVLTWSS